MASSSAATADASAQAAAEMEPESSAAELVQDPAQDIAMNEYQEKLTVGVPGRRRCQVIYISTSKNGKRSKDTYNVEHDAPPAGRTPSIIPLKEELTPGHNTEAHLVVGVILARHPFAYSDKSKTPNASRKNKGLSEARKKRGVLPATTELLRVTVPLTEYIQTTSHKYYVACHQMHGICGMRVISSNAVFFFDEVYSSLGTAVNGNLKNRTANLGLACRTLAATNKTSDPRAVTTIKKAGTSKTVCHDLEVTREQNAANTLWMQFALWQVSKEPAQLDVLTETVRRILPDLANMPSNEGTAAFFSFEEELQDFECAKMVNEVKVRWLSG